MLFCLVIMAFLLSAGLTYYFSRPEAIVYLIDQPNARSLHTHPIPHTGGIAIMIAFVVVGILACILYLPSADLYRTFTQPVLSILLGGSLIAIISFLDDCYDVSPLYRLIIHFLAAYLLLWQSDFWLTQLALPGFIWILPNFLQISLSLLFIVWMVNLYNFMDGMDGFAGGMAVFGFGGLAWCGFVANQPLFMSINLIIVSAAAGFLVFNFPPAKIFMGDVGASNLGFLAAGFGLWGDRAGIVPLWVTVLLFSPFIIDATVTLLRRLGNGEKVWQAHKTHYYQRLVQLGWGHRRTVLWEYGLMTICGIFALYALDLAVYAQWVLLISVNITYGLLIYLVNWLENRQHRLLNLSKH